MSREESYEEDHELGTRVQWGQKNIMSDQRQ